MLDHFAQLVNLEKSSGNVVLVLLFNRFSVIGAQSSSFIKMNIWMIINVRAARRKINEVHLPLGWTHPNNRQFLSSSPNDGMVFHLKNSIDSVDVTNKGIIDQPQTSAVASDHAVTDHISIAHGAHEIAISPIFICNA